MLTRKALTERIDSFISALANLDLHVRRVVLFGSYAKGNPHDYSDIDLAIWADEFEGAGLRDIDKYVLALRQHPNISVHPFRTGTQSGDDPFLEEILCTGKEWPVMLKADK
jgi:uncharacterized protein